jgi:hypothetical protein
MRKYNGCLVEQDQLLKDKSNSFFERDMDLQWSVGAIFHPSISVNNHTYRGEYDDSNELFKALCSTMLDRPSICSTFSISKTNSQD